jgi:hypothetical protein
LPVAATFALPVSVRFSTFAPSAASTELRTVSVPSSKASTTVTPDESMM